MFKRIIYIVALVLLLIFTIAFPVFAAPYSVQYTIAETSGNAYTMLATAKAANISYMITNGFMEADGLDTRIQTLGGIAMPHMVVDDTILTATAVPADSVTNLYFTTGNADLTALYIITGYGGYITVSDAPALELGDTFEIIIDGYIDTAAGASKNLINKPDGGDFAFKIYISGAGTITASIDDDACVVSTAVASGEHEVRIIADGYKLSIYIDDVFKTSTILNEASVPNTADDYLLLQNNVAPYVEYIEVHK
jgi:hypothetical protein